YRPGSATRTSSTRCVTPNLRLIALGISGDRSASRLPHRRRPGSQQICEEPRCPGPRTSKSTSGDVSGPHTMHSAYAPRLHLSAMSLRPHTLAAGFIAPCLPTKTDKLPSGGQWLHEIKHDGFKKGSQVRLYSRPANDLTRRFPLIVETLARLRSRSCIIDAEAVARPHHRH